MGESMTRILLGLLALLLVAPAFAPAASAAVTCPAGAEITTFRSNTTTIVAAGNSMSVPISAGQALVFSLDGGFYVDIDHWCLGGLNVTVMKNGAIASSQSYEKKCEDGTHSEWVPMGLETAEVTVNVAWWGCDGTRGGVRGNGTAGDPPVFTPEGEIRLLRDL